MKRLLVILLAASAFSCGGNKGRGSDNIKDVEDSIESDAPASDGYDEGFEEWIGVDDKY